LENRDLVGIEIKVFRLPREIDELNEVMKLTVVVTLIVGLDRD